MCELGVYLSSELRALLDKADNFQCAYCQTSEINSGLKMSVDHVIPEAQALKLHRYTIQGIKSGMIILAAMKQVL